jgi:hypothetical protein
MTFNYQRYWNRQNAKQEAYLEQTFADRAQKEEQEETEEDEGFDYIEDYGDDED